MVDDGAIFFMMLYLNTAGIKLYSNCSEPGRPKIGPTIFILFHLDTNGSTNTKSRSLSTPIIEESPCSPSRKINGRMLLVLLKFVF
jgi:hypothetical protein